MQVIEPSVQLLYAPSAANIIRTIETAGRTCYKSHDSMTDVSGEKFIQNIVRRGHESVLEHASATMRFICDRGVSHEIVRHRIASYSQESTRYCNYSKEKFGSEITVIRPLFLEQGTSTYNAWFASCATAETSYFTMLNEGCTAQEARSVLPNSLKTELVMTANMREWRHFLKLRTSEAAHPQMRQVALSALNILYDYVPVLFEDIMRSRYENI